MRVELLNERDEVLLVVTLTPDGHATWEGSDMQVIDVSTGKVVDKKNGAHFLRALPWNFRSAYLRAVLRETS